MVSKVHQALEKIKVLWLKNLSNDGIEHKSSNCYRFVFDASYRIVDLLHE